MNSSSSGSDVIQLHSLSNHAARPHVTLKFSHFASIAQICVSYFFILDERTARRVARDARCHANIAFFSLKQWRGNVKIIYEQKERKTFFFVCFPSVLVSTLKTFLLAHALQHTQHAFHMLNPRDGVSPTQNIPNYSQAFESGISRRETDPGGKRDVVELNKIRSREREREGDNQKVELCMISSTSRESRCFILMMRHVTAYNSPELFQLVLLVFSGQFSMRAWIRVTKLHPSKRFKKV